ncbi:hypothetical protein HAX54_039170, partial [Datura stramonium]|nr:hypothetical protein [Datura stramonium]
KGGYPESERCGWSPDRNIGVKASGPLRALPHQCRVIPSSILATFNRDSQQSYRLRGWRRVLFDAFIAVVLSTICSGRDSALTITEKFLLFNLDIFRLSALVASASGYPPLIKSESFTHGSDNSDHEAKSSSHGERKKEKGRTSPDIIILERENSKELKGEPWVQEVQSSSASTGLKIIPRNGIELF